MPAYSCWLRISGIFLVQASPVCVGGTRKLAPLASRGMNIAALYGHYSSYCIEGLGPGHVLRVACLKLHRPQFFVNCVGNPAWSPLRL